MARWKRVRLEEHRGAAKLMKRLLMLMDGFASRVCTVTETRDGSYEVGGRFRGSQGGGGTQRSLGVSRPRNQCPRLVAGAVSILGQIRVSCRVVVSTKLPAMCVIV